MSPAILDEVDETTAVAEPYVARWLPQQYYDPLFKPYVIGQLRALSALEQGWDGYHAPAPSGHIIDAAVAFIHQLTEHVAPRPRVVPLSSGAVQFEWVAGSTALELEFESPTTIHYLKWKPEAGITEEDNFTTADLERAEALIRWFIQQQDA